MSGSFFMGAEGRICTPLLSAAPGLARASIPLLFAMRIPVTRSSSLCLVPHAVSASLQLCTNSQLRGHLSFFLFPLLIRSFQRSIGSVSISKDPIRIAAQSEHYHWTVDYFFMCLNFIAWLLYPFTMTAVVKDMHMDKLMMHVERELGFTCELVLKVWNDVCHPRRT